jgi:hypothetical protein
MRLERPTKQPPGPAADQARWAVRLDETAPPGDVVPALARLLLALAQRRAKNEDGPGD